MMRWLRFALIGCLAMLALASASPALASSITFDFAGTITQVPVLDPNDPFGGTICDGTNCVPASTFTGSYTFDSGAPDAIASTSGGSFQMSGTPFGLQVTIGGNPFSVSDFLAINTQNSAGFDFYGVLACTASLMVGTTCTNSPTANGDLAIELALSDFTGTALGTDALPLTPPNLASFSTAVFSLFAMIDGNQVELEGNLTSLTCSAGCAATPVPEPATLLLVGAGLIALRTFANRTTRKGEPV